MAMNRTARAWIIAAVGAAVLILLLVLWGMRPGRQGQPGQPGHSADEIKASALVLGG
jgi:high-affinity Fe2+/Pb2+ permease